MIQNVSWPRYVRTAIRMLEKDGYECYAVGGCVRDLSLGQQPHDWDLTTSALPEETARIFDGFPQNHAGMKHGTVGVLIDGEMVEITTYRVDGDYSDARHPEQVSFTRSLKEDLARRDFTVNAMALHPQKGLFDLFDGQGDLERKILRAVGNPEKRMQEDALRILRGLRFLSRLQFSLDPETEKAMLECREELKAISAERVFSEIGGMLLGDGISEILIRYPEILSVIIPEITPCVGFSQQTPYHIYDVWGHIAVSVGRIEPDPVLRWTMLFHDIGKPKHFRIDEKGIGHFKGHAFTSADMAEEILERLRCPNKMKEEIVSLIRWHDITIRPERTEILHWLGKLGPEGLEKMWKVRIADNLAKNVEKSIDRLERAETLRTMTREILKENPCYTVGQLEVNGRDLIEIGVPKGKRIGETLNALLEQVIEGKLGNEREALINAAKAMLEKYER